jgi:hypothetical protein
LIIEKIFDSPLTEGEPMQSAIRTAVDSSGTSLDPALVRSLYRRFLRIYYKWPAEPTRPGRNLRDHLHQRIRATFRSAAPNQSNPIIILRDAEYRLKHLTDLVDNVHAKQYGMPETFAPIYRPAYKLLDTDVQLKQANLKAYKMIIPMMTTYAEQAVTRIREFLGSSGGKANNNNNVNNQ